MYDELRKRLLSFFPSGQDGLIYLKGGEVLRRYDTDFEYPFRQESNFLYATGIDEPDMAAFLDISSGEYIFIIPRRDAGYAVWMGVVRTPETYVDTYGPDVVLYQDEVPGWLQKKKPPVIHCLSREEALVKAWGIPAETEFLKDALDRSRSIKTKKELSYLKEAAKIANEAHIKVMKAVKPGKYEYEMKAIFEGYAIQSGQIHSPYSGIYASGRGSAILHYTLCHKKIKSGELFLIDAGTEYRGYASDITRTYPVNGVFSPLQADLYDIVLEAQSQAIMSIKPDVRMETLHYLVARIITEGLCDVGLLMGDIDSLMENNIHALFFPHGLGHLIGLDTHDVGGYLKSEKPIDKPGIRHLRTRRRLKPGMVLTIEPGLYFIPALLQPAFNDRSAAPFLNVERLSSLFDFGGIRIEDNIRVSDEGFENLTMVPKTRKELREVLTS